jgi:hypothetical protein
MNAHILKNKEYTDYTWIYKNPPYAKTRHKKIDKKTCKLCGKKIARNAFVSHQKSKTCELDSQIKYLCEQGYTQVKSGPKTLEFVKMLKDSGIPVKRIANKYPQYYTPTWAMLVINTIRYAFLAKTDPQIKNILQALSKNEAAQNTAVKLQYNIKVRDTRHAITPPAFLLSYEDPIKLCRKIYIVLEPKHVVVGYPSFYRFLNKIIEILKYHNKKFTDDELKELGTFADREIEILDTLPQIIPGKPHKRFRMPQKSREKRKEINKLIMFILKERQQ